MPVPRPTLAALLSAALLPMLSGCGAGLIGGVVAGNRNNASPPPPAASPPSLTLVGDGDESTIPLVLGSAQPRGRLIVINNFQLPDEAVVRVEVRALGVVAPQLTPFVVSVNANANSSTIGYFVDLTEIVALVDPTDGDVAAELFLFVDGEKVGNSVPITLIGQREATHAPLVGVPASTTFVSVRGNGGVERRMRVRVTGRLGEDDPLFRFLYLEPSSQPPVFQVAPLEDVVPVVGMTPGTTDWLVSAFAPPASFPAKLTVLVEDELAGASTPVFNFAYKPKIITASPNFGATNGITQVVLFGQGLAPLTDPRDPGSAPDFDKVEIDFVKGGRVVTVPGSKLLSGSDFTRLVFVVPPTPDGQPGPTKIVLRVDLGSVEVSDERDELFVYRHLAPGFGPRGALLSDVPVALRLASIEADPSIAPDAVALSSIGGFPRVELLVALQNGMFASFGPRLQAGQPPNQRQSQPSDLAVGDFDADGDADVLVINAGVGGAGAHNLLTGEAPPLPPLQRSAQVIRDDEGGDVISLTAPLTGMGRPDTVLIPRAPSAQSVPGPMPRVILGPSGAQPNFTAQVVPSTPGSLIEVHRPYEAAALEDVDGDGLPDLVVAKSNASGANIDLLVALGAGSGDFPATGQTHTQLIVPGYTVDASSPAVGVHVFDGVGPRPIALVLAGLDPADPNSANTPPTVVTLLPDPATPGAYLQPTASEVLTFPAAHPFVTSAFGDLDLIAPGEVVVASVPGADPQLRLMQWSAGQLTEVAGAFAPTTEPPGAIRSLSIGLAVPVDGTRVLEPIYGVFMHHDEPGAVEDRLSTWLAKDQGGQLTLTAPDASLERPQPHVGIALGNFGGQVPDLGPPVREARDLCLATPTGLHALRNDGVGGFTEVSSQPQVGIVSGTLITTDFSAQGTQGVAFLLDDGRVGSWLPSGQANSPVFVDLRPYALKGGAWDVAATSHQCSCDLDGDGADDLVVSLVLENPADRSVHETVLLLFRGRRIPAGPGNFPFHVPDLTAALSIDEEATSTAVGEFTEEFGTNSLEAAVAFPYDGNEIRFYRYDDGGNGPSTDDKLVPSSTSAQNVGLVAGEKPRLLIAADFDPENPVPEPDDLAVVSEGDSKVRIFLNVGQTGKDVDVNGFVENPGIPALPAGLPTAMMQGDFDGDAVPDLLVTTAEATPGIDQQVACYLSSGTGSLNSLRLLTPERTGNLVGGALRSAEVFTALADVNWDGLPDLVLAWGTAGAGDRNVRVLFGAAR